MEMTIREYLVLFPISNVIDNYVLGFEYVKPKELEIVEYYLSNYWIKKYNNFVLNLDAEDFFDKFNDMIINNIPLMLNGMKQHNFIVGDNILNEVSQLNISGESTSDTTFSNMGYNVEGNYQKQGAISGSKSIDLMGFMERFNTIFLTLSERMGSELMNYLQLIYGI